MIIVPGGGFGVLVSQHEGSELATWFRDRGFVAAVLQHRCPTNKLPKMWEFPAMDTQRAVSLLRSKAAEFGVQPGSHRALCFSAGGQVALIATTNDDARLYPAVDDVDKRELPPGFPDALLCVAHSGGHSLTALEARDPHRLRRPRQTFLAQANDDKGSLAEGSTLAFLALRKAGVSAELHIYSTGGHGFGLRPNETQAPGDWPGRLELWLKARGLLGITAGRRL